MDRLYFQWHITDACNFRCRHCYQKKFDGSPGLDIKSLKSVSDRIIQTARRQNKKVVINITGGEPFLKKEFPELLDYLDEQEEIEQLAIITNGSLINTRIAGNLKKLKKLKQLKISLEGSSVLANDAIRTAGSFDAALAAMRLLKEKVRLPVTVMFTAMKSNLGEIVPLCELCQNSGINGLIIERFFPLGQGIKIKDQLLDAQDWRNLINTLLGITEQCYFPDDMYSWRAFWIKFLKRETVLLGASCNVGMDAFCIMPGADVFPCRRFVLKIGNLLDSGLEEIMHSSVLMGIINSRRKGRCSGCGILDCRGCPALSYLLSGDYLSEDTQCVYEEFPKDTIKTERRQ